MSAAEYACIASLAAALCLLAVLAPFAAVRLRRAIADRRARRADRSAIALFSSLRSSGLLNSSSQCADAMLASSKALRALTPAPVPPVPPQLPSNLLPKQDA